MLGANGLVGRMLMQLFQANDLTVQGFSHGGTGASWSPDDGDDLTHINQEIGGLDCLINLAAPPAEADIKTLTQNSTIALAVLDDAHRLEIPTVFLMSSAAIYSVPKAHTLLKETTTPSPVSDYGRSKLAMEQAVHAWRAQNPGTSVKATCLRVGNVAGADKLLMNTQKETPLRLDQFADGSNPKRSYVGPLTLARILTSLCKSAKSGGNLPEALNIAAPTPVFMTDLLDAAQIQWQAKVAPQDAIKSVCLDTTALNAFYQFKEQDSDPAEITRQWRECRAAQCEVVLQIRTVF